MLPCARNKTAPGSWAHVCLCAGRRTPKGQGISSNSSSAVTGARETVSVEDVGECAVTRCGESDGGDDAVMLGMSLYVGRVQ